MAGKEAIALIYVINIFSHKRQTAHKVDGPRVHKFPSIHGS